MRIVQLKNNYRLDIQYDGTKYNGWQKQGNTKNTIQGILEEKLAVYLEESVEVKGSGRTDRGVHAAGQVANFYTEKTVDPMQLQDWLNHELTADIHVNHIEKASRKFHSRKSAVKKTYEYCIWNSKEKNVFYPNYAYAVEEKLDLEKIKRASRSLLGTHDFIGFSSLKDNKKSTVRTIMDISVEQDGKRIFLRFTGSGFLYNMVRILSGTLIEIGKGNLEPEIIEKILEQKNRALAGPTAPAQGLKLLKVYYSNEK